MKFPGRTFLPARKAQEISERILGQISEQISGKILGNFVQQKGGAKYRTTNRGSKKFEMVLYSVRGPYDHPSVANPFSPYSIQKRPEPQICPKFMPTIVFSEFQSVGPQIRRKFVENLSGNCRFSNFRQIFDKFGSR